MESPTSSEAPGTLLVLQLKSFVGFKSQDEYLFAMKEDLADWFTCLYKLEIGVENFFDVLDTGVRLCEHANKVRNFAQERRKLGLLEEMQSNFVRGIQIPEYEVQYRSEVRPQTFHARDNISNFIKWTKDAGIPEVLSFETDDLVLRKNEKNVVLCLLEIARIGAKLGMLAPTIVQMEEEIDAEIAGDPPPQIITCDVKSLDEMVKWLAGRCTCPVQFPIIKVGEGKYKIGDSQTLVFVRILRKHVMIRVGGGWDTLEHYLDKHDPCRCNFGGHRMSQGAGQRQPTTPRRSSTPVLSQTLPSSMKSPRKSSLVSNSYQGAQRPPSPVRMRSASPGPNPRKLPTQPNLSGSSSKSSLSSNSSNNSSVNVTKNNSVSNPGNNKLRSPSPVPSNTKLSKVPGIPSNRPTSPIKRCSSPAPAKRCTSPSPARKTPTPSKHKIIATSRSTPNTPGLQRRQLPPQPNMDSCGNSESSNGSVPSMDQISTMTLDEFKNLLNNALSVPNGNNSEASVDSPRSQSSTDSYRNYSVNTTKKPPVADHSKSKTWSHSKTASNVSKSFDSNHRSVKNHTILEKPELPEKPKKLVASSGSWNRPKTPTSSARPKTPVSSVTNSIRPKTPVSSSHPKTPVSSARPKTPTSIIKPNDASTYNNVSSEPSSRNSSLKNSAAGKFVSDWANQSTINSRFSTETNLGNDSSYETNGIESNDFSKTYTKSYDTGDSTIRTGSQVNTSRDKSSMGSFTGMMASRFSQDSDDIPKTNTTLIQPSSFRTSTELKSNKNETNSSFISGRSKSVTMKSDGSYLPPKEDVKPNVGYVSINAEDTKYSRKHGGSLTSSNNVVEHVQNKLGLTDSNKKDLSVTSENIGSSGAMESKFDLFKKTFQSSSVSEQKTSNTSEFLRNNPYSRENSQEQKSSEIILPENISETNSDTDCKLPRPSTPSGRCTPSLIPRPSTPIGNLKELKEKAEKLVKDDVTSVTRSIENLTSSILTEQTSPVSTEAPSRRISLPAQSSLSSGRAVVSSQSSSITSSTGRPPTPRKSNILVKAQTPSATKGSYTSQFMQRRAITPGPSKSESKMEPVRRSRTPGPNEHSLRRSENFEMDLNESNNTPLSRTQNVRTSANVSEPRQSRTVPSSPVVQRRPITPSAEPRGLSRQTAVDEETVIMVDRSKGQHCLSVQRNGETAYKSPKPSSSRIIARSPAAGRSKQNDIDATERNRLRSKSVDVTQQNTRSKSIDRTRNRNESGEVALSVNRSEGSHVINKRTEAWVEDAAKTVAKTRHGSKLNKSLSHGYQRSKTPSPMDMRNHKSKSLDEIKAELSLPINGISLNTETLEAPPEDPEMYATMDKLFKEMRKNELRASVNETPGIAQNDITNGNNDDEYSLDSNENVKRKVSVPSRPSSRQSTPSRESVKSTPSRPKTPSMSRSSSSSQPINRPASTPPRPCTPTRSKTSSRRSSMHSEESSASSDQIKRSNSNHATILVSKIKEMLNVKPRRDIIDGPKTRIPAPASLSKSGKSRSFSNLCAATEKDNPYSRQSSGSNVSNGGLNGDVYDDYDECGNEVGFYSRNTGSDSSSDKSDKYRSGSGSKTPVPKIATPLSTGRTSLLNNPRDNSSRSSSKLIRAVSASSLSSTTSQTWSYTAGEDDGYV
ncbi:mucin-5AC-like [Mytilus californianus]|uniref:mucin-5AC-like n=1 Tax=Mytilus californianus TaxID=6549 RepID=UPI00224598AA|nr:mucin-5AC-like [Mytilus californianus]